MRTALLFGWLLCLLGCPAVSGADSTTNGSVTLHLPDGSTYTGSMKDGLFHGKGTRLFPKGEKYDGEYVNGQASGRGVFTGYGGSKYEGHFLHGEFNGQGTYVRFDGTRYAGEFKDGALEGNGEVIYSDGGKAKGQFKDWVPNGTGAFVSASGTTTLGEFKHGRLNGEGVIRYASGAIDQGTFKNGVLNGPGKIKNSYGELFEGIFKNGKLVQEKEKAGNSDPFQSDGYPGGKPMYNIHGLGQTSFWLPFLLVISVFFNVILLLKPRPRKNWSQPQLAEKPAPDYSEVVPDTEPFEKIAVLENEVQAEALDALLAERGIPHEMKTYHDSALDGVYLSSGWGHVAAPKAFAAAVMQALKDLSAPPG